MYELDVILARLVLDGIGLDLFLAALAILIGIPLVAGYVGAVILDRKGRSAWLGFFIGVALAVIGLIAYLLIVS